ncbi:hypothetical protein C8Q76DRAFT_364693 [Earliella scabrosa]|nr:hypothetical protein C8Q76DRAFT_364693 [Earliella scabrosa]
MYRAFVTAIHTAAVTLMLGTGLEMAEYRYLGEVKAAISPRERNFLTSHVGSPARNTSPLARGGSTYRTAR